MESGHIGEPEKAIKRFTLSSAELTLSGKFAGSASQSSFDEWVQKVEIVFSSNQLSEAYKERTIPLLFTGSAYSYWGKISEHNHFFKFYADEILIFSKTAYFA